MLRWVWTRKVSVGAMTIQATAAGLLAIEQLGLATVYSVVGIALGTLAGSRWRGSESSSTPWAPGC